MLPTSTTLTEFDPLIILNSVYKFISPISDDMGGDDPSSSVDVSLEGKRPRMKTMRDDFLI